MRWTCCFPVAVPVLVQGALCLRRSSGRTVGAASAMHEDAAVWEMMEAAFAVARRMVEVREMGLSLC